MTEEAKEYYCYPYNATFCVMKFHADQYYSDSIPLRRAVDYTKASEVDAQLFSAADVGDVKLLEQMLEQGANVNFQHCAGTPLIRAARRGHLACVQTLLDHGADINLSGNFNCQTCTALHASASNGHYEVAQLLIDHGADLHAKRAQGSTPLHDAAKFGHPNIALLLLQHGAQVNVVNARGKTPVYLAVSEGKLDGLRWVLEAVIEYYHYRGYHYNESFFPEKIVEHLLDNKDKVNALDMDDLQDLRMFLLKDDLNSVKLILEERPTGNIKSRHLQLLKVLFEAGANPEILDEYETGPLEEAIVNNDEECVSFIVNHGAIVSRPGAMFGCKGTPLHHACSRETEGIVKILLENGADPNVQDEFNRTPLHTAVYEGNAEIVRALLLYGAKVDVVDDDGETPLHKVKTLECAKLLVDHGADVTAVTKCGKTVLFSPSDRCGEGACVQFLIDQGADPLKEDENGTSAIDLVVNRWHCDSYYDRDDGGIGTVKALMKHGAKLNTTNWTLNKAITSRRLGLALALLRSDSDVNAVDHQASTELYNSAKTNFTAAVEILLEEGADPNVKFQNKTPLDIALLKGHEEAAKLLLQAGAIPDPGIYNTVRAMRAYTNILKQLCKIQWQDSEGNSVMHIECYRLGSMLDLIDAEADTNVADKNGITPLHIVCFKGSISHVKLLLENKADPNKKDKNGSTPLHFAAFEGHHDVGALLLKNGADVNAQDIKGITPAHIATQCNSVSFLELLLAHGTDVNARNKQGWTLLHQAERNGYTECVELLVKHGADRTVPIPDYYTDSKIPPHLFKNISKFVSYEPESEDEVDMGFGLFD